MWIEKDHEPKIADDGKNVRRPTCGLECDASANCNPLIIPKVACVFFSDGSEKNLREFRGISHNLNLRCETEVEIKT